MSFLGHNRTRPGAPSSLCHPDTTGEIASSRPWSSSLAGSRDKSGEEAESRLGECNECNSLAQEEGEGGRGELDGAAPALREEQTRRGSRKTIGPPTGTDRASLSQTPGVYQLPKWVICT